jgi:alpha-1,2-mannosyltransferase
VLWWVIKTIQAMDSNIQVVLYTGDDMKDYEKHVKKVFNIELDRPIHIVRIRTRFLVELPVKLKIPLTLLAQSLATMIVGLEALVCLTPDIFIDTYGAAFTFLGAKVLAGCKVATYTHYPTISTVSFHNCAYMNRIC